MNLNVDKDINKIFLSNDEEKKECLKKSELLINVIKDIFKKFNLETSIYDDELYIIFDVFINCFEKGEYIVNYSSTLKVSKIFPAYYLQHEFSVPNLDIETLTPDLEGFGTEAYCFKQNDLETILSKLMIRYNYRKLYIYDLEKPILDQKKDQTVNLETLLFKM